MTMEQLVAMLTKNYQPQDELIVYIYDIDDSADRDGNLLTREQWSRVVTAVNKRDEYVLQDLMDLISDAVLDVKVKDGIND